jgi:phosphatidylserine/phosphatidylglycerophosphate/cardiolipin synthase-like enzyme
VHDIQAVVDGPAARALGDIARARWRLATGEHAPCVDLPGDGWPAGLRPQFKHVPVAISRTVPAWNGVAGIRESSSMAIDALRSARRAIYIEAQYFASTAILEVLLECLAKPSSPEIVAVVGLNSRGLLERYVMGRNRDRLARRLAAADDGNRFRIFYPAVPWADGERELKLHSKLIIVDDRFLRVGSSNLNNRSEGLDTECDIAIESQNASDCETIAGIRDGLLAEHLGVDAGTFARVLSAERSLIRTVERLNHRSGRVLRELPALAAKGPTRPVMGSGILDPSRPFRFPGL